jgi:hypothetical protein
MIEFTGITELLMEVSLVVITGSLAVIILGFAVFAVKNMYEDLMK